MKTNNSELFEKMPVPKAITSLVVPTVLSQLITVIYNMADTFFVGQLNNPAQVAATTVAMPAFVLVTGIANLLGVGGASLISRSLGEKNPSKAKRCSAFCIWTSIFTALIYGLGLWILHPTLLPLLGAKANTFEYCRQYLFWTVTIGAIPTALSACLAHLVRSEGYSRHSSLGIAFGGVLNMILDPIFIFVFKLEIRGAAIATLLSNIASVIYFLLLLHKKRDTFALTLNPKFYTLSDRIPREVIFVGLPSCLLMFMGTASNIVLNNLVASYSTEAMAGLGIAKKIDMIVFTAANGMAQGVLPLIGYNYAAKNSKRMRRAIKFSYIYSVALAIACVVLILTCAVHIAKFFIDDAVTVSYSQYYLKVLCFTCPCISITMMSITIFQATGKKLRPVILSILRKGGFDIPLMFLLNHLTGVKGIVWAYPIADVLAMITSLALIIPYSIQLKRVEHPTLPD